MRLIKVLTLTVAVLGGVAFAGGLLVGYAPFSPTQYFGQFYALLSQGWEASGRQFVSLVPVFSKGFSLVLVVIPVLFFLHYLLIGPKSFSHERLVYFYRVYERVIHWFSALFFSALVVSGIVVTFASAFGGGGFVRFMREVHLVSAFGFLVFGVPMFFMWLRDMLFAPHDVLWFFMGGGYLTKKKVKVPAGRYNAGQKLWFWFATAGGFLMFYTGFYLYLFKGSLSTLRTFVVIHNFLGMAILALFITHLYMTLFAVKGALRSMITGYKSEEELCTLHSKYYEERVSEK